MALLQIKKTIFMKKKFRYRKFGYRIKTSKTPNVISFNGLSKPDI